MVDFLGIQIIGVILAVLVFYEARVLYQKGRFKKRDFGIWSAFSIVLIVFSLFPSFGERVLKITSLGRGLDAFLVLGIFGSYVLVFQVYIRIQETNRQLTDLTRKIALKLKEEKKK